MTRAKATDAVRQRLTPFARELVNSLQFYQTQAESLGIGGILDHRRHLASRGPRRRAPSDDRRQRLGRRSARPRDPRGGLRSRDRGGDRLAGRADRPCDRRRLDARRQPAAEGRRRQEVAGARRCSRSACRSPSAVPLAALSFLYLGAHGKVVDQQSQLDAVQAEIAALPQPTAPGDRHGRRRRRGRSGDRRRERPRRPARVGGGLPRHVAGAAGERLALDPLAHPAAEAANLADGDRGARAAAAAGLQPTPTAVSIDGFTYTQPDVARLLARLATLPSLQRVTLTSSQSQLDRDEEGRPLRHRCRPEPDRRCVMSDLLRSPKGKIGAVAAGGLLVVLAVWFLLVSPQRAKATELSAEVGTLPGRARRAQGSRSRRPSANVTVKPSDLYRLTKALPDETDMSGILLDVNRIAAQNKLTFKSITPAPAGRSAPATSQQPLDVVVQGRFGNISRFLGDLRTLVSVRGKRLDARGRLYSVSAVNITAPGQPGHVPGREGGGDAERLLLQRPGAADDRPLTRPRLPTRPRAGRSRQERPPDGQAKPQDLAAAKAKKQKIILIVGGVLLLAVAAFQGPKLMKRSGSTAAPAAGCRRRAPTGAQRRHRSPSRRVTAPRARPSSPALRCRAATVVKVATSQLASFTLFEVKDPFVQQVERRESAPAPTAASPDDQLRRRARPATDARPAARRGSTGSAPPARARRRPRPPAPIVYATINFDGKPQQVQVKGTFPTPRAAVRPPLAEEEAGEDRRRRRLVRRRPGRHAQARQEGDARQHGDRRPLRAEARLHRRAARGDRGLHDHAVGARRQTPQVDPTTTTAK